MEGVSVKDHDVFTQRHLRDMGQEVEEFRVFTWRLKKWKSLGKRITSNEFSCGGHRWRILLFPLGNVNSAPFENISVYFEHIVPEGSPLDWHVCAQFALVISNPVDPTVYFQANVHHRFTSDEVDWGFTQFAKLRDLYAIQDGHRRPIIEDESADVSVYSRVMKDPTGVLWHNFKNYDSKKRTGYAGIKEEGGNNYICAILHTLFGICAFRRAVYQLPAPDESGPPSSRVASALQSIFYDMQVSDKVVTTEKLTTVTGWRDLEKEVSQDAVHFARMLRSNLELRAQGTPFEGAFTQLCMGKMRTHIEAVNVDFQSSLVEDFDALQLNVNGIENLQDSFQDYLSAETLDGDLKYDTGASYGLQDAKKRTFLNSLPPILEIDLKRYRFDVQAQRTVKNNDRFEFPLEIDLVDFLDETADKSQSWLYDLYGIVIHSGELSGGRYFCFLKPSDSTWWLKFDHDRVVPVVQREVFHNSYGGKDVDGLPTSAYALFYLRRIKKDELFTRVPDLDLPTYLKPALDVKILDDGSFKDRKTFDLSSPTTSGVTSVRALETDLYQSFKATVATQYKCKASDFRTWVLTDPRCTGRSTALVSDDEAELNMKGVCRITSNTKGVLWLYLERIPQVSKEDKLKSSLRFRLLRLNSPEPPLNASDTILIFIKHWPVSRKERLIGKKYVDKNSKVSEIRAAINQMMGWRRYTRLVYYMVENIGQCTTMNGKASFQSNRMQNGGVLGFRRNS